MSNGKRYILYAGMSILYLILAEIVVLLELSVRWSFYLGALAAVMFSALQDIIVIVAKMTNRLENKD